MKITFLISGNVRSNFSARAVALAGALHKLGHDITIIAPKADKYNNFVPETIHTIDGVKVLQPFQFATRRPEINLLPYLFGAAGMVLQEKSDLICIFKPTPITVVGFIVKIFRKTPIVVDMDDLGSEVMRIEGHPWHQRKLVEWSEKFSIKHADRLIVVSTYLFKKYRKEFPGKPIHIIPNGVGSYWFDSFISSEEKHRIVFFGAINRVSILEPLFSVLPDIIREYPDVKIIIMGSGKNLGYFKQKSEDLSIASNITFTGWLSTNEARSRLRGGDIGYNYMPNDPTTNAASNMKVAQYMARGIVPLVSDIGDLSGTVEFGTAGYICKADNTGALRSALLYALEDENRLKKSEQARSIASQKLTWDHLVATLNEWLNLKK